jgi:hypothetical protein
MAGRPANVTQAELERAIRAAKAEGLTIARIVARPDGVAIEIGAPTDGTKAQTSESKPRPRPVL